MAGTRSRHRTWHANPHTSQTTPCRVRPTIRLVQWLHLSGEEKVRTMNWWERGFRMLAEGVKPAPKLDNP